MATNDNTPSIRGMSGILPATGHHPSERARPGTGHCGGEYSQEEVEFMVAMDRFKRRLRRMPTAAEVLVEAIRLGYQRLG